MPSEEPKRVLPGHAEACATCPAALLCITCSAHDQEHQELSPSFWPFWGAYGGTLIELDTCQIEDEYLVVMTDESRTIVMVVRDCFEPGCPLTRGYWDD